MRRSGVQLVNLPGQARAHLHARALQTLRALAGARPGGPSRLYEKKIVEMDLVNRTPLEEDRGLLELKDRAALGLPKMRGEVALGAERAAIDGDQVPFRSEAYAREACIEVMWCG
jgi:hypothetical protein